MSPVFPAALLGAPEEARTCARDAGDRDASPYVAGWLTATVHGAGARLAGFSEVECIERLVGRLAGIQLARAPAVTA